MIHANISPESLIRLGQVMMLWQGAGAKLTPLPWTASQEAVDATRPPERAANTDIQTPFGFLVASGEQAFMDMAQTLQEKQIHIGWTPCFRHEPTFDPTHHYYFLKAEAFIRCCASQSSLEVDRVRNIAMLGFESLLRLPNQTARLEFRQTGPVAYDIECNGIEVGSYGVRTYKGHTYVFGTALAEPRWSEALTK